MKANILIVEDDKATANRIKVLLTNCGYVVSGIASSGEEAIDMALSTKPDLILLDIILEGQMDGITAYQEIRKTVDIPVIIITACIDEGIIVRAMDCSPRAYLVKPFRNKDLLKDIRTCLADR